MSFPDSIGGYFGLELRRGEEYHAGAIKLNTGRNALAYILEAKAYSKIYLPYFGCDVLLQPLDGLGVKYEFYYINNFFEPEFDFSKIAASEVFLYTNYFGIKDEYILTLKNICPNLIVDNAQSFFSRPMENVDTIYSARKFFGVPDGAYCYSNKLLKRELPLDESFDMCEHLLRRIDESAENGHPYFLAREQKLNNQPIKKMSHLTSAILKTIDYEFVANKRKENFQYLHNKLKKVNALNFSEVTQAPLSYPFYSDNTGLRQLLTDNRIYTPIYWLDVLTSSDKRSIEIQYAGKLIHLPIDQRYDTTDIDRIIKIIMNEYNR